MVGTGYSLGVDQVMFFGLGFFLCGLLAIAAVPFVHNRAKRLTEQKLDQLSPISMEGIQNEKDMMRAEFAMTARRLETSIDELKSKASAHLGELTKKTSIIAKLKEALEEREKVIAAAEATNDKLESRTKELFDDLQIAKADVALRTDDVAQAERALSRAKTEINDLRLALEEREHVIARQVTEIATLRSHVDMVRSRVAEFADEIRQSESRLAHDRVDLMRMASPSLGAGPVESRNARIVTNGVNGAKSNGVPHPHINRESHPALNGAGAE